MKYIPAEKLIAEIERLKELLTRGACAAQTEMETNCKDEAYNEVLSFITYLQQEQPPLPSNADEAAEEYEHNLGYYECINQWPSVAFKAGAKWVAEQGASFNTKVGWIDGPTILDWPDDILDKFEMGDNVIVQIRKKEE